jgi:hypothetical protein
VLWQILKTQLMDEVCQIHVPGAFWFFGNSSPKVVPLPLAIDQWFSPGCAAVNRRGADHEGTNLWSIDNDRWLATGCWSAHKPRRIGALRGLCTAPFADPWRLRCRPAPKSSQARHARPAPGRRQLQPSRRSCVDCQIQVGDLSARGFRLPDALTAVLAPAGSRVPRLRPISCPRR